MLSTSRSPRSCTSPSSSATPITPGRRARSNLSPGLAPGLAERSGNTNGLVRRYLPYHTDLHCVTQKDLDAIASELPGLSGQDSIGLTSVLPRQSFRVYNNLTGQAINDPANASTSSPQPRYYAATPLHLEVESMRVPEDAML